MADRAPVADRAPLVPLLAVTWPIEPGTPVYDRDGNRVGEVGESIPADPMVNLFLIGDQPPIGAVCG